MVRPRIAKATAALERLEQQAVTLDRLEVLAQRGVRLSEVGITYDSILARRDEINALADDGVQYDFNDALLVLYDETFGSSTQKEEG